MQTNSICPKCSANMTIVEDRFGPRWKCGYCGYEELDKIEVPHVEDEDEIDESLIKLPGIPLCEDWPEPTKEKPDTNAVVYRGLDMDRHTLGTAKCGDLYESLDTKELFVLNVDGKWSKV